MSRWFGLFLFLLIGLARVTPAAAQDVPKVEVAGGYQYLQAKSSGDSDYEKFKAGWFADVAANVNKMFAVVFNVGGNYKTLSDNGGDFKLKVHEFMGGGRVNARKADMVVVPFGQVLVGGVSLKGSQGSDSESETDFGVIAGGGVKIVPKGKKVGAHVGVDWLHVKGKSGGNLTGGDSINGFRFVAGITIAG